jgi:multiple antibiotic resistance protein
VSPLEYGLLAFSSLFAIVDPIATIPAFLAMTPNDSTAARVRTARLACIVATGALLVFTLAGRQIFALLGVTLPAFELAGSLLLLRIAFDMLYAVRPGSQETAEEVAAGAAKDDIAISPLGVPMLAGPGAISTVLILATRAETWLNYGILMGCIVAIGAVSYGVLHLGARGASFLNPLLLKLVTRLMGLVIAAIAVQFAFNALAESGLFANVVTAVKP